MTNIRDLFKESPFEPLRYHMKQVMASVALLPPMFEALQQGDYDKLDDLTKKVFKMEHEADIIKDEIRQIIPHRFFLPVYRGDLLGYLKLQDDMADAVEDVAVLLTIKKLTLPSSLVAPTMEYVNKVIDVCERLSALSDHLPTLVAGDMVGEQANRALEQVAEIEHAEWVADRTQYNLSKQLFAEEDQMRATDVMLWFRIYGEIGQLANYAEKTGDRLRRMLST